MTAEITSEIALETIEALLWRLRVAERDLFFPGWREARRAAFARIAVRSTWNGAAIAAGFGMCPPADSGAYRVCWIHRGAPL